MREKQFEFNVLGQKIVIKNAEEAAVAEVAYTLHRRKRRPALRRAARRPCASGDRRR